MAAACALQPGFGQQGVGGAVDLGGLHPRQPRHRVAPARAGLAGQLQVVAHGQLGEHARDLEGATEPEVHAPVRRQARHVVAAEGDAAAAGLHLAGEHLEQRGLAGAVGADHHMRFAGAHADVHVVQHVDLPVGLAQAGAGEQRRLAHGCDSASAGRGARARRHRRSTSPSTPPGRASTTDSSSRPVTRSETPTSVRVT